MPESEETRPWEGLNPPYRTIVADPPWRIGETIRAGGRRARVTTVGYSMMTFEDICALPVAALGASHLYLWSTAALHRNGSACLVAREWGFKVVGEVIWAKPNFGMGAFPRPQHEVMLVCRSDTTPFARNDVGSVQSWAQVYGNNGGKSHSQKPAGAFDLIESASPGPYVELFARQPRLGWDHWGYGIESVNA